jgi:hypothetical protein
MEKAIAVMCILVLGVTAVDGVVEYSGVDLPGFSEKEQEAGEGDWSDIKSVTMPQNKLREIMHYDHIIRIELYFENKTSGEWTYWALDVSGQELIKIPGIDSMIDGFGEGHSVMELRRELSAQFTVFLDDSEGESITSDGEYDVQRDEYMDLMEEKMVRIDTNANISVDELPSTNIPLSFRGFTRSYFDPHLEKVETMEEGIYGNGQTINLGDTNDWTDTSSDNEWLHVTYDWTAERGVVIAGYDTMLINVTTDFGDDDFSLPFMNMVWISNEVSYPVKQFIRTNTSWDGEEEAGYILLENTFILRQDGFTEGSSAIPWGDCTGYHWLNEHPMAETQGWSGNYMPQSGSNFEDSSFHWKPDEVIDWLEKDHPSDGLALFLTENPDAIVTDAKYNASVDDSDPEGKSGEFWWNLSFGHERRSDQTGSGWNLQNRYRVLVYNNTEWEWDVSDPLNRKVKHNVLEQVVEIDFGKQNGSAPIGPSEISSQTVTMASSEEIFRTDDKVIDNFYSTAAGLPKDLDWGDGDGAEYNLGTSSGSQGAGMDLIETLTGIQTQVWGKYTWSLSEENLMEGGTMASVSLDAETGRLISYMEIEGTALANAFSFGD